MTNGSVPRPRRWLQAAVWMLAVLLLAAAAGGLWLRGKLRASLPKLDGEVRVAALGAPVTVERDDLGVPTIRGADRDDVSRALGFVHAQDRFFQMDLTRRRAAGELSALLGPGPLALDRAVRVHRFRARARARLELLDRSERRALEAYAAGVNAGLAALAAAPFEYLALDAEPEPWRAEDSLVAVYAMYLQLNDERGARESDLGLVRELLGPEMFEFLNPLGTEWDAPVTGDPFAAPPVPPAAVFDLRTRPAAPAVAATGPSPEAADRALGSNNWALAGELTADGGSLLANDMHLGLSVPNIWYRASLVFPDPAAPGGERRVTGVTLPGGPVMVAGSNGQVAWGFTNSYGDWSDLVLLEPDPADPEGRYLTPEGPQPYTRQRETITVKGAEPVELEVLETIWGPVIDRDHRGRRRALAWIAHHPEGLSMKLFDVELATDLETALDAANRVGAPPQNFVAAADDGRIGWTIMGAIPRRYGHAGRWPVSWASGERGWDGFLDPGEAPRMVAPPEGRIWTANARVVGGEAMAAIGVATYRLGARQRQIRDGLRGLERPTPEAMLSIQLDDRALFLVRWRELLLELLDEGALEAAPRRRELRRLVEAWGGRAAVDSAGYRFVRAFRELARERLLGRLTAECRAADERFSVGRLLQAEGPLWRLVRERPPHLLDPAYADWRAALLATADAAVERLSAGAGDEGEPLADRTWGERNTAAIAHPMSRFLPAVARRWLDMPREPLPGDRHMPRFQAPAEGASERFAVSPGREASGYFHMPTGQSGHPLSPHYRDGHAAWVEGRPTPFLPGPAVHTLVLTPGS